MKLISNKDVVSYRDMNEFFWYFITHATVQQKYIKVIAIYSEVKIYQLQLCLKSCAYISGN